MKPTNKPLKEIVIKPVTRPCAPEPAPLQYPAPPKPGQARARRRRQARLERALPYRDEIARLAEELAASNAGRWPIGIHRLIAVQLDLPTNVIYTALGDLRARGAS